MDDGHILPDLRAQVGYFQERICCLVPIEGKGALTISRLGNQDECRIRLGGDGNVADIDLVFP